MNPGATSPGSRPDPKYLLDVNVLLAAIWCSHPHHAKAGEAIVLLLVIRWERDPLRTWMRWAALAGLEDAEEEQSGRVRHVRG